MTNKLIKLILVGCLLMAWAAKSNAGYDSLSSSGGSFSQSHSVTAPSTCWIHSYVTAEAGFYVHPYYGTVHENQMSVSAGVYGPPSGVVHLAWTNAWGYGYYTDEKWNTGSPNGSCPAGDYYIVHNAGSSWPTGWATAFTEVVW